jgi:hypothetical protein
MVGADVESRYIQLQEEYIKDEQRYASLIGSLKFASMAKHLMSMQKLEEGASASTGRDQAHTECAIGHRTVYGGYRSEVCISKFGRKIGPLANVLFIVPESCKARLALITSSVSCPRSTARS